jgi:Helix-turn-helix domain
MTQRLMLDIARHSTAKGNAKLILMLIASYAHPDGTHSEASLSTLANQAGISRRQVQTIVKELATGGHVILQSRTGPHDTNRYAIQQPWRNDFPREAISPGEATSPGETTSPGEIISLEKPFPMNVDLRERKEQSGETTSPGEIISLEKPFPQLDPKTEHWVETIGLSPDFTKVCTGKPLESDDGHTTEKPGEEPARPDSPPPSRVFRLPSNWPTEKFELGEACAEVAHQWGESGRSIRRRETGQCQGCYVRAHQVRIAQVHGKTRLPK